MESKKIEIADYLNSKLYGFLEPMMIEVLKAQPSNPTDFCVKWLQKHQRKDTLIQNKRKMMTILTKKTMWLMMH